MVRKCPQLTAKFREYGADLGPRTLLDESSKAECLSVMRESIADGLARALDKRARRVTPPGSSHARAVNIASASAQRRCRQAHSASPWTQRRKGGMPIIPHESTPPNPSGSDRSATPTPVS